MLEGIRAADWILTELDIQACPDESGASVLTWDDSTCCSLFYLGCFKLSVAHKRFTMRTRTHPQEAGDESLSVV